MAHQDIRMEDLLFEQRDGTEVIQQDEVENIGLYRIPNLLRERLFVAYMKSAAKKGNKALHHIGIFVRLSRSIHRFPTRVQINFTSGRAYKNNLKMLRRYT